MHGDFDNERPKKLILFEGPEGSGKTSAITSVEEFLKNLNISYIRTKEPGHNTPRGHQIRKELLYSDPKLSPDKEEELFFEGRADHFDNILLPALDDPNIRLILIDRSSPSTIAYQHFGRGRDLKNILRKDFEARQGIEFDLVLLFDLDPLIGLGRTKNRGELPTNFEKEVIEFHERVRQGYLWQLAQNPATWIKIDAGKPKNEVAQDVIALVSQFLNS